VLTNKQTNPQTKILLKT